MARAKMEIAVNDVRVRWDWKPIPHCPGRFTLASPDKALSPEAVLGGPVTLHEFIVAGAKDRVVVVPLTGGGLISYRRDDGSYVHTLNTVEGFARKLAQLGISLEGYEPR